MNRYDRVIQILDNSIGGPNVNIAVHGAFWRGLNRDAFVGKKVLGLDLLKVGNAADSNLIKALKGESPFGDDLIPPPAGARYDRMPSGLKPVANDDITFIAQWIDDGCPSEAVEPPVDTHPPPPPGGGLQWRPTNAPVASSRTDDIWFADPQTRWAVNSNGQIVKTTDGFDTFHVQFSDAEVYLRCIGFASGGAIGWAGSLSAPKILFGTRDGGVTWTQVANLPANAPSAVCGLSVVNDRVAYMSGTNFPNRPPRMMKTLDGGATCAAWEMQPWASLLIDTYFVTAERGWVVGGLTDGPVPPRDRNDVKAVVLQTEDGGKTWVNRAANLWEQLPKGEWGWKIQFISEKVGFVSLESFTRGAILKTTDGGLSWTRIDINDPQHNANLEGVGFIDERQGWVGGWGDANFQRLSTSATRDGGKTWQDANEVGKALNRFRFFGNPVTLGYASGQTVYKYSSTPAPVVAAAAATNIRPRLMPDQQPLSVAGKLQLVMMVPDRTRHLTVRIWDRFGDLVAKPVDEAQPAPGRHMIAWQNNVPGPVSDFIVRVTVDGVSESRIVHIT